MMKKILNYLLILILFFIGLFLLYLAYSSFREYKPKPEISLLDYCEPDTLHLDSSYSVMIWNIGYSGLGKNMDFFYDGGKMVRDTKENVNNNFSAISEHIKANDTIDFFLLQEVDLNSKRSYHLQQFEDIGNIIPQHVGFCGINYKVDFVPVPPKAPLGKVESGIVTYTKYQPAAVFRRGFTGNYSWPTRLFMLKRCMLVSRFPTNRGNEFVLVNIHNSAYDDGSLRAEQLSIIDTFALNEFNKGNFILLGGDWNQSPDGFNPAFDQPFDTLNASFIPQTFLKGWERYFSDSVPSNRRITIPYMRGKTLVTVIDYYITSPNLELSGIDCVDLSFEHSDHQPVTAIIRFRN